MLEERVLDLPMREADVAIRMKEPSQADLIRRKLMTVRMCLYAVPEYLDKAPPLEQIEDITNHRLICQNVTTTQVSAGANLVKELLTHDIKSMLTVNNYFGVLQSVNAGLGIGVLPDYVIEDFPNIQRVLPDVESIDEPVFLAFS